MKKPWISANTITALRICGAVAMAFLRPLCTAFLVVYTLTGVTDVLDGWVARKTGTASDFGARLDSAADLTFYGIMAVKLLPVLWRQLPRGIWWPVGLVLALRIACYVLAAVKYRRFAAQHTYLNKLTGLSVFLIPNFLITPLAAVYCTVACIVALLSTSEELAMHATRAEYDPAEKTIFRRKAS